MSSDKPRVKNETWRLAATNVIRTAKRDRIRITQHGSVHPCFGGAFVEASVWVTDDDIRAYEGLDKSD